MKFTKMQGLGNDYIYLNCMDQLPSDPAALARTLSDRHFGIGGDGLICLCASTSADIQMRMFNADGSEGAMCGNGIRCLGKYAYDKGLTKKTRLFVETTSGIRELSLHTERGYVTSVTVDMGLPCIGRTIDITVNGDTYTGTEVSMGNPHFVVQTTSVEEVDLARAGSMLGRSPHFPDGVNIELVHVLGRDRFNMRVWERGSGETLACGTGASAAMAALSAQKLVGRTVTACLPGGELELHWREEDGHMLMTGPAVIVFEGEWYGDDQ